MRDRWPPRLTPLRREILERLRDAGAPVGKLDALGGHPNVLPTLRRAGWVKETHVAYVGPHFEITDAGLAALSKAQPQQSEVSDGK
jgi:hypothetical protein